MVNCLPVFIAGQETWRARFEEANRQSFTIADLPPGTLAPLDDVIVTLDTTDPSEGVAAPTRLTFTARDWPTPQTVVVTGQDDAVLVRRCGSVNAIDLPDQGLKFGVSHR